MAKNIKPLYAYEGLVISGEDVLINDIKNIVLLLNAPEFDKEVAGTVLYGVHKNAFQLKYTKITHELLPDMKNLQRRMSEPLLFGDVIRWYGDGISNENVVYNFERQTALYDVRLDENGKQIKIGGVVHPSLPQFWSHFGTFCIGSSEIPKVEPNVWLNAWIRLDVQGDTIADMKLDISFIDFDNCDISQQHRVSEAPWFGTDFGLEICEPCPVDDDDEILVEAPESKIRLQTEWCEVIKKQVGLYVGDRLVISKDMPQYDFIIPIEKHYVDIEEKVLPSKGEYVFFSACWSAYHKFYLVTSMYPVAELQSYVESNGNISVAVTDIKNYEGFFTDVDNTLGLIDDPDCLLSFWKLSPIYTLKRKAYVEIVGVRASINKSVRFRIVNLSHLDNHSVEYNRWINSDDKVILQNQQGVIIDADTVISTMHPNILFRFQKNSSVERFIGSLVKFHAFRPPGFSHEMFIVKHVILPTSCVIDAVKRYIPPNVAKPSNLLKVRLKRDEKYEQLAHNEDFGFVDIRDFKNHIKADEFVAWIMESPKIGLRRACTTFEIISTSNHAPMGVQSWKRNRKWGGSSVSGSVTNSEISSRIMRDDRSDFESVGSPFSSTLSLTRSKH